MAWVRHTYWFGVSEWYHWPNRTVVEMQDVLRLITGTIGMIDRNIQYEIISDEEMEKRA